jgi:hypothetical protein
MYTSEKLVQGTMQLCFCPHRDKSTITTVAYAGISAAMKVAVMHLSTISCRRILYSTFQGKSVSYSIENTVVPEVSQDLVVIFKITQSTVRKNLPSDIM